MPGGHWGVVVGQQAEEGAALLPSPTAQAFPWDTAFLPAAGGAGKVAFVLCALWWAGTSLF